MNTLDVEDTKKSFKSIWLQTNTYSFRKRNQTGEK